MNEQMKNFYDQVGLDFENFQRVTVTKGDMEKFAELIVCECMNQIEEVRQIKAGHPTPDYEQGMNDGMFVAIRTIEEHFGVEE